MRSLDDRQESLGTCTYIGYKLLCKLDNIFEEVIFQVFLRVKNTIVLTFIIMHV